MSEFRVDKPGFYWRRDGKWAFAVFLNRESAFIVDPHGQTYWVYLNGRFGIIQEATDLIEYIGPTMPEALTRPEPEKKLRPWKPEEVPVGAVIWRGNDESRNLIISVLIHGIHCGNGSTCNFQRLFDQYRWKWPHEPDDAWRPCVVLE